MLFRSDNGKEFTDRLFASREREPSGNHVFDQLCEALAPLLDETSRGLGAAVTITDGAITAVQVVPVYLGSSGRPNILQPGEPNFAEILAVVAERTAAAGLNGVMDADGRIELG